MTKSLKVAVIILSVAIISATSISCSRKAHDRYNKCPAFSKKVNAEKVVASRNG